MQACPPNVGRCCLKQMEAAQRNQPVRVGTLSECISEGRIAFDVTYAHGLPFAFLKRKFALDKVGGFLCLRRGGNKQPRVRLEPGNPRLEISSGDINRLLL